MIENVDVTVTVGKANPTYDIPTELTATYGDTLADVTLPDGWTWADDTQSVGDVVTPAATFKATFTPEDTDNYNTISDIDVTVTVNKADIEPTVTLEGWTYGETAKTPVVDGNLGEGEVTFTYAKQGVKGSPYSETVPTDAGNYVVKATIAATANYNGGEATAEFTIAQKTIKVTADALTKTVGSSDPELTYKVEGLVGEDKLEGSLAREEGNEIGTYAITQGTLAASDNYVIDFTGSTLTIKKKPVPIVTPEPEPEPEPEETPTENHVETDVNVDENAPEMKIENISEKDATALLTEEEKQALDNGEKVKIYLEVVVVDETTVPADDKAEIENEVKKSEMKVGMYLDLSLFKKVGSSDAVAIHDTDGNMVKVTVTVPEELRNTDPDVKRTFYVVRVHDGVTTILGESTGDTISFETDKFSTYSLTYKDEVTAEIVEPVVTPEVEKKASLAWLWILIAVLVVAACVTVIIVVKKKKKTTK